MLWVSRHTSGSDVGSASVSEIGDAGGFGEGGGAVGGEVNRPGVGQHQATKRTSPPWPRKVLTILPVLLSQTRVVSSFEAVAILVPSGDHAHDRTKLLCPVSVTSARPLLLLHTRDVKSSEAVAILVPSGDHSAA